MKATFSKVEWITDEKTKKTKMKEVEGSDFTLDVDMVLLAMGFLHAEHSRLLRDLGVKLDARGNIQANNSYSTNVPAIFVAGDASLGASLVVRAIYQGREAAKEINRFLGE